MFPFSLECESDQCLTVQTNAKMRTKKKTRRGSNKRKQPTEKLTITGTNANGLKSKKDSLLNLLSTDNPQVFMIQETKMKKKNQMEVQGYELFEKVRKGKDGGGVMIGVKKDLEGTPVIVSDHDDDIEILVVEVVFKSVTVRSIRPNQKGTSRE